jgi:AcrR family transcriptional regulator
MDQIVNAKRPHAPAGAPGERARTRILDTAEALFADEGPAAVTLRSIAAAAGVNVAAVNYYFGSKDKLFEEMFLRRVVPLNEERLARLTACIEGADGAPTLEDIVAAYVMPALQLTDVANDSARAIVVQYSLGRVLAAPEVNEMLGRYYARVREAFVAALRRAVSHLAPHEVVWRYYWMGGSVMVALAVPPGMIEASDLAAAAVEPTPRGAMPANLIAFLVQGIRAPSGVGTDLPESAAAGRPEPQGRGIGNTLVDFAQGGDAVP